MFSFPALPASRPSRGSWYQDLLDDPACQGDPTKVEEAYMSHRQNRHSQMVEQLCQHAGDIKDHVDEARKPYARLALISNAESSGTGQGRLKEPGIDNPLNCGELQVNCLGICARPTTSVHNLIEDVLQKFQDLLGEAVYAVPMTHRHLSVIEFSHRHEQTVLEGVMDQLTFCTLQSVLRLPARMAKRHGMLILLTRPMVSFDSAGIALSFVPAVAKRGSTYHDLRNELQKLALMSPIEIDTCYTAATAHIAIARFIRQPFVTDLSAGSVMTGAVKARKFLDLIGDINRELEETLWPEFAWNLVEEHGLEVQMGYLKFGRERELATLVAEDISRESSEYL